ncbi:hypothetical protein Emed_003790 [Eimeria media]
MGGDLHPATWGFPQRDPVRPLMFLRCTFAVLCLAIGLVLPLTSEANTMRGERGGFGVYSAGDEAEGSEWHKKAGGDRGADEAELAKLQLFQDQNTRPELLASAAVSGRRGVKKHSIVLASSLVVVLTILGTAAFAGFKRRSGSLSKDKSELVVTPETETKGLLDTADSDESSVSVGLIKDAIASAKQAGVTGAPQQQQQQQQEEMDLHIPDPVSSLQSLLKPAVDKAQVKANEAKAIVQRTASRAYVGKAESQLLSSELAETYSITTEALESSIRMHAREAGEALKRLERLPSSGNKDESHLMSLAQDYISFINYKAKACVEAEDLLSQLDEQMVKAHKLHHLNKEKYHKMETLHASMKAYKAVAMHALNQQASTLSREVVKSLDELVKAVTDLEEQFKNVIDSYSVLLHSNNTAKTMKASDNVITEEGVFMDLYEVCLVKLKETQSFFDNKDVSCVEGSKVLEEAVISALEECLADYRSVVKMFQAYTEETVSMLQGSVQGFKRPLISPDLIKKVTDDMDAMQHLFLHAVDEIKALAAERTGTSFKDDLEALEKLFKARSNVAHISKRAADYKDVFTVLTLLELDIETSAGAYRKGELSVDDDDTDPHSDRIRDLLKQFKETMNATQEANTLPDLARAANKLRTSADHLLTAIYEPTQN